MHLWQCVCVCVCVCMWDMHMCLCIWVVLHECAKISEWQLPDPQNSMRNQVYRILERFVLFSYYSERYSGSVHVFLIHEELFLRAVLTPPHTCYANTRQLMLCFFVYSYCSFELTTYCIFQLRNVILQWLLFCFIIMVISHSLCHFLLHSAPFWSKATASIWFKKESDIVSNWTIRWFLRQQVQLIHICNRFRHRFFMQKEGIRCFGYFPSSAEMQSLALLVRFWWVWLVEMCIYMWRTGWMENNELCLSGFRFMIASLHLCNKLLHLQKVIFFFFILDCSPIEWFSLSLHLCLSLTLTYTLSIFLSHTHSYTWYSHFYTHTMLAADGWCTVCQKEINRVSVVIVSCEHVCKYVFWLPTNERSESPKLNTVLPFPSHCMLDETNKFLQEIFLWPGVSQNCT